MYFLPRLFMGRTRTATLTLLMVAPVSRTHDALVEDYGARRNGTGMPGMTEIPSREFWSLDADWSPASRLEVRLTPLAFPRS